MNEKELIEGINRYFEDIYSLKYSFDKIGLDSLKEDISDILRRYGFVIRDVEFRPNFIDYTVKIYPKFKNEEDRIRFENCIRENYEDLNRPDDIGFC